MVPVAFAIALVSALWMVQHLARRYPSVPKQVPFRIEIDGRPSKRLVGKWFLWVAPAVVVAMIVVLGVSAFVASPSADDDTRSILALALLIAAELAYFLAWITDRQIELARKMTYRIAPARTLRAALPILVTTVVVVVIAARL
jgi:flagellar biosynthesis protein FliQ